MPLSHLPPEILLLIVEWLDYTYEINSLARTNRTFYALLNPWLYTKHAHGKDNDQFPLRWAASGGSEAAARKLLAAGVEPSLEALLLAATFGHERVVALLHEKGVDINAERTTTGGAENEHYLFGDKCRGTPLVRAVIRGREGVVRLLLELGANPNCAVPSGSVDGKSPMEIAASCGNSSMLQLLIEALRKVKCPDLARQLEQCLYLASHRGDYASVQVLLEAGARPNPSSFHINTLSGNVEVIRLLLQNGYRPTMNQLRHVPMKEMLPLMQMVDFASLADNELSRATVLAAAAACGNLDLVSDLILFKGWPVDGPPVTTARSLRGGFSSFINRSGHSRGLPKTPLVCAAQWGHMGVVQFLLAHGADPWGSRVGRSHNELTSSLAAAVQGGKADIVSLLIDHGVGPNTVHDQEAVLLEAIKDEFIFKILLDRGADISIRTSDDDNPLSSSVVQFGTAGVVRLMCERGVNFDHPTFIPDCGCDRGEYTLGLLELLAQARDLSVLYALMEHGGLDPQPDRSDARGALLEAAMRPNMPYLRFLLNREFDPRSLGVESDLVFHAAALAPSRDASSILDMLVDEYGLDVDALDDAGQTPLLRSASWQENYEPHVETVRLLLSRGADLILQCSYGKNPLMIDCLTLQAAEKIAEALSNAIEAQKIPFDKVKTQLLQAIETEVLEKRNGVVRILRRLYWRLKYPVPE